MSELSVDLRRAHKETDASFAWTGVSMASKEGYGQRSTDEGETKEQVPLYFEITTRASKLPLALLLAATLEAANCLLEHNGINNTLALRCGGLHFLELKYSKPFTANYRFRLIDAEHHLSRKDLNGEY